MTTAIYIFTTLLFFIIAGISVLLAYKRGFFKSVIKLGITVVSLAISVLITLLSSAAFSSLAETIVKDGFLDRITSNDVLGDIIEASPTMTKFIFAIPGAIIGPIAFVIIFAITKFILDVAFKIISSSLIGKREIVEFNGSKIVSCVFGFVIAFITVTALVMPVNGLVDTVSDAYRAFSPVIIKDEGDREFVGSIVDGLDKSPAKLITYELGGRTLYNSLTSFTYEGKTYSLGKELSNLMSTVSGVMPLTQTSIKNWSDKEADAVSSISDSLDDSELVPVIVSEVLSSATSKWLQGEKFAGLKLPETGNMKGVSDYLVELLSTTTPETVKGDVSTICDSLALLIRNNVISSLMSGKMSTDDMIGLLTTEGLLSEEFGILYDNPRFRDSIPKITKFCLTTAGQQLKLPKTAMLQLDFYTDVVVMIKEVNNLEKTESERSSLIYNKLVSLFSKYGITVDKGTVNLLAKEISVSYPLGTNNISLQSVKNFFRSLELTASSGALNDTQIEMLFLSSTGHMYGEAFEVDFIYEFVTVFKRRKEVTDGVSAISSKDLQILCSLSPENDILTTKPTLESIVNSVKFEEATRQDVMDLGSDIAFLAGNILKVLDSVEGSGSSNTDKLKNLDTEALGEAFDVAGQNKIIGDAATDLLSAGVKSATGFDVDLKEVIDNSDTPGVNDSNYKDVLTSLKDTVVLTENIKSDDMTHDQKVEEVQKFMDDLTPESATSISKIMSTDVVAGMGGPSDRADSASDIVKEVFSELGKTEDKSGKEAEAVKYLFDVALNANEGGKGVFGEEGRIDNADTFVSKVIESQVASKAILSGTTNDFGEKVDDPLKIGNSLSDSDKAELFAALNNADRDPSTTDEQKVVLEAIANLFGTDWMAS